MITFAVLTAWVQDSLGDYYPEVATALAGASHAHTGLDITNQMPPSTPNLYTYQVTVETQAAYDFVDNDNRFLILWDDS